MHSGVVFLLFTFAPWAYADNLATKQGLDSLVHKFSDPKLLDKLTDAIFEQLVQASGQIWASIPDDPLKLNQLRSVIPNGPSKSFEKFFVPRGDSPNADTSMELKTSKSHGVRGVAKTSKLQPFRRERPLIDSDKTVKMELAEKGVWRTQQIIGNVAKAQGVMDVQASPSVVWNQLFDFSSYPKKVPVACAAIVYSPSSSKDHTKAENFGFSKSPLSLASMLPQLPFELPLGIASKVSFPPQFGGIQRMFVKFQSAVLPGVKVTAHCDLTYEPAKNSVTYQLDKGMRNHFDEIQGHWHVAPHPDGSSRARVFYEMALTIPGFLPRPVVNRLARSVVKDATSWVKEESEREAATSART